MPDKLRQQTNALIIANNPQQDSNRKILQRVRESLSEAGIGLVSERAIAGAAVRSQIDDYMGPILSAAVSGDLKLIRNL